MNRCALGSLCSLLSQNWGRKITKPRPPLQRIIFMSALCAMQGQWKWRWQECMCTPCFIREWPRIYSILTPQHGSKLLCTPRFFHFALTLRRCWREASNWPTGLGELLRRVSLQFKYKMVHSICLKSKSQTKHGLAVGLMICLVQINVIRSFLKGKTFYCN